MIIKEIRRKNWLFKLMLILISLLVLDFYGKAQDNPSFKQPIVNVDVNNRSLREVLQSIESQVPYKFAYNTELISQQENVSLHVQNKSLEEVLTLLLKGYNLTYTLFSNQIIINEIPVNERITISGFVKDYATGETLPGAVIYLPESQTGSYTNNYGYFFISHQQTDSLKLLISYMGFSRVEKIINVHSNSVINFYLTRSNVELNTVLVTENQLDDHLKNLPGKTSILMDWVKAMPGITGNGDLINSLQMTPGVIGGLDGRPGYFIRGGNTDQNLIQLDEATLYNPGHMLGLVGVFNSSAIKSAYLLKAGFPASYGDHLSSVLDVTMRDGDTKQYGGELQLGTMTSGFTFSGPLQIEKSTFLFAVRRSTIDLLLKPFDVSNYYNNYNFFDINTKLNFKISPKDRLFISFYQGRDHSSYARDSIAKFDIDYNVNYGNSAFTGRWNHIFSPSLFSNTSVTFNKYFHEVKARQQEYYAELYSGIKDLELKTDLSYFLRNNQRISVGVNYLYQTLYPAAVTTKNYYTDNESLIDDSNISPKYSNRVAAYFSDEINIGSKISAYLGLRVPFFTSQSKQYLQVEPRISLMYLVNPSSNLKVSYTQMHQYLHLVESFNASFPAQVWIGSNNLIKPQKAQEVSLGFFKNFHENVFESSIEVYYKKLGNQIMFRGGNTPAIDSDFEKTVIFGEGQSYGMELFIEKSKGKLTGQFAYTLSYSYQQFDSLNLGKRFPFANDRRHNFSLTTNYSINYHWQVSTSYIASSGSAFTLFQYISPNKWTNDNPLFYYSGNLNNQEGSPDISSKEIVQNNFRLTPYNRLDLSLSYRKALNISGKSFETEWILSVYNVYARKNTYFAYCSIDPVTRKPIAVEVSFVPVIANIAYSMKF